MRISLLWKLLAINAAIIAAVILVVWIAVDVLAADYFSTLMERYNISPGETHQMFVDAIHRYLIHASVAALALAVGLSFLLTRRVLRPLSNMAEVTRRVAAGDYSARVAAAPGDEIGELARAFNRMADSLERIEGLRKTMVADMAHELRTPLTTIRGYLEAMADGVVPPSRETCEMLQDEVRRLVRLVEDLQQLTKAEAAKAYLQRREIVLPELVEQVLRLYRPELEARGIRAITSFAAETARVMADPDKLIQVLRNLIQNACQYTPEGGRIRIASARTPEGITVTFANSSGGLGDEDLPLLFERFYRAEKSRSRESGGAGIGLAIVKELVEAHDGQVGVARDADEVRFWFTLPA